MLEISPLINGENGYDIWPKMEYLASVNVFGVTSPIIKKGLFQPALPVVPLLVYNMDPCKKILFLKV